MNNKSKFILNSIETERHQEIMERNWDIIEKKTIERENFIEGKQKCNRILIEHILENDFTTFNNAKEEVINI